MVYFHRHKSTAFYQICLSGTKPSSRPLPGMKRTYLPTPHPSWHIPDPQHRGLTRNLFRRGQKSGFRHQRGTEVGSGAKPQKLEKNAENLIECQKFHTVQRKNIFSGAISEGDMSPLPPPCTPPEHNSGYATDNYRCTLLHVCYRCSITEVMFFQRAVCSLQTGN